MILEPSTQLYFFPWFVEGIFLIFCNVLLGLTGSYGGGVLESPTSPTSIVRVWFIYSLQIDLLPIEFMRNLQLVMRAHDPYPLFLWFVEVIFVIFCGFSHGLVGCGGVLENPHCLSQLLGWGLYTCWETSPLANMVASQKSTVSYTG